ncbi:MAG TPA: serine/threonine-protein kinase [Polyangiales bacterium]
MFDARELVAGRYKLERMLGEGGSASVWQALDHTLERTVAIKFLYAKDERYRNQQVEQFLREARLACAVQHPNVIHTLDFGTARDRAYMVMELLAGEDLAERVMREPKLELNEIVRLLCGVLRGLAAIHEAGIVHRDLKPENIFLLAGDDEVHPKIIDFGIARNVDPKSTRRSVLTSKEGVIVGTPQYMSPEHIRGVPDLDHRTDLWSVGVILYELLTGRLPYEHANSGDLAIMIATTDAPRVSTLVPSVPPALAEVVSRALNRDRHARFQTATEMLRALRDATRDVLEPGAAILLPSTAPPPPAPTLRPQHASRSRWAALAVALLLLASAWLWSTRERSRQPPHETLPLPPSAAVERTTTIPKAASDQVTSSGPTAPSAAAVQPAAQAPAPKSAASTAGGGAKTPASGKAQRRVPVMWRKLDF